MTTNKPATPTPPLANVRLVVVPDGWPTTFEMCPPGFFVFGGDLFLKSEYITNGKQDAYCESGEYFWGGVEDVDERRALIVQPCKTEWQRDH